MSLKLEVGKFYLSASGEIIKINGSNKNLNTFLDINDNEYEVNGICVGDMRLFDLIAYIPKQLHFRLCEIIEDYYIDIDVKEFIDNNYKMMKGRK